MAKVTIVDFGSSNLLSVYRAFDHCRGEIEIASEPEDIGGAERLVLPGVGAFRESMNGLSRLGLGEAISEFVASGRPFLGICVGMQMMLEGSEEFGDHPGLGLIPGRVRGIPAAGADGRPHKIPHIGWNALIPAAGDEPWRGTILDGIEPGAGVYFVHSFAAEPAEECRRLADCDYDGISISAVIRDGNAYGCQFHPEKSGPVGLRIIENFMGL